jgi:hypothetical protein
VPDDVDIVPLIVTDDCGELLGPDVPVPPELVVKLCYRERQAELMPALASDPSGEGNEATEAGQWNQPGSSPGGDIPAGSEAGVRAVALQVASSLSWSSAWLPSSAE